MIFISSERAYAAFY